MSSPATTSSGRAWAIRLNRLTYRVSRHWFLLINLLICIYIGLPWLAPVFMTIGWVGGADLIYRFYSTQCHQLPQRSFFLFGSNSMYSLDMIQSTWQDSNNPMILRQFIGTPEIGWKVAWSDRMVYMYSSLLFWGVLFWPFRKRLKQLSWWGVALLLLPMFVDGSTHMISDIVGGIGGGFRYDNSWLASLTGQTFPATFYSGDAFGSFNSWMRLLTGVLFGLGVIWLAYPAVQRGFADASGQIATKFEKSGLKL